MAVSLWSNGIILFLAYSCLSGVLPIAAVPVWHPVPECSGRPAGSDPSIGAFCHYSSPKVQTSRDGTLLCSHQGLIQRVFLSGCKAALYLFTNSHKHEKSDNGLSNSNKDCFRLKVKFCPRCSLFIQCQCIPCQYKNTVIKSKMKISTNTNWRYVLSVFWHSAPVSSSDAARLRESYVWTLQLVHVRCHDADLQTLGFPHHWASHSHRETVLQQLPWYIYCINSILQRLQGLQWNYCIYSTYLHSFWNAILKNKNITCIKWKVLITHSCFRFSGVSGWFLPFGQWSDDDSDHQQCLQHVPFSRNHSQQPAGVAEGQAGSQFGTYWGRVGQNLL